MEQQQLHIIIDNGHGNNTPGKCSPDRRLLEYQYTREIAKMVKAELDKYPCLKSHIIVHEDYDVTLKDRMVRANGLCKKYGTDKCIFISIHNNAAGNSGWKSARGWQCHIYRNASENSKVLANLLFDACTSLGLKTRKPLPDQKYWECGYYVCKNTLCPAVLTENFFQDNKQDVDFLLSNKGKQAVTMLHVNAVLEYYKHIYGKEPETTIATDSLGYGGCSLV